MTDQPPAPPPPPGPDYPATSQFPPVNYAPPGHAPDYGSPYPPPYDPGPPGYPGYPPPPRPARRSNAPLVAVIIAVALLLCGGVATAGILVAHSIRTRAHEAVKPLTEPTIPALPTDVPTDGGFGQQIKVTYQVTGDGPAEILYFDKLGAGPTRLDEVTLPWSLSLTMQTPTLISITAMHLGTSTGQVTCRAMVDGKEVKKVTSGANAFGIAACSYFALN